MPAALQVNLHAGRQFSPGATSDEYAMLNSLGIQIERHWREHRPKMVKALDASGHLSQALHAAQNLTLTAEAHAMQAGMTPDQARERFREEWAFLPAEEDVPDLPRGNPAQWPDPERSNATTACRRRKG